MQPSYVVRFNDILPSPPLRIRLGEWDVNNDSEFYAHVEYDATNIFLHEEFYPGNLYNDIAIIRLNGYVDYARKYENTGNQ